MDRKYKRHPPGLILTGNLKPSQHNDPNKMAFAKIFQRSYESSWFALHSDIGECGVSLLYLTHSLDERETEKNINYLRRENTRYDNYMTRSID